ncbi:MAG TPA: polyprenyl synthetase family protein [Candidatus Nitrosotenuis sp.]|jgi:geranylgeranyl pyrophosphate synthase|nr:polyprenyl synthetase family protein [Candidatus Nitrosotenuis sp.]
MTQTSILNHAFDQAKSRIEGVLHQFLQISQPASQLQEAIRYAVENGGKRLRPFLVYQCADLLDVTSDYIDNIAAAIELIHCYSLVHDDLPDMDNSPLRRGKPSCWKQYGTTTAILVGDALQPLAFEILAQLDKNVHPQHQLTLIHHLAIASGRQGMVAGQMMDMFPDVHWGEAEIRLLQSLKTGQLFDISCISPGILANTSPEQLHLLHQLAHNLGLMYQIMDDILDKTSLVQNLGKPTGQDQTKLTLLKVIGLTKSRGYINDLHAQNLDLLNQFGKSQHLLSLFSEWIMHQC